MGLDATRSNGGYPSGEALMAEARKRPASRTSARATFAKVSRCCSKASNATLI